MGAKLVQRRCSGAAGQRFALERFGDASRLKNPATGLCLDQFMPAGKVSGDIGAWSCHSGGNQLWRERR